MLELAINPTDDASEALAKHRHAVEAARAVENSTAWKVRRLLDNVSFPSYSHTPKDLATELVSCRDQLQDLRKRGDDGVAGVRDLVQAGDDTGDFGNLESILDLHRSEQLSLLRDVAEFFSAAHDVAQRHIAALRPLPDKLHAASESVVAQSKKDLNAAGFFVDSMPGYSAANREAAERRFDFLARHGLASITAISQEHQVRADLDAAVEAEKRIPERLQAAKSLLQKITMKAIVSAV